MGNKSFAKKTAALLTAATMCFMMPLSGYAVQANVQPASDEIGNEALAESTISYGTLLLLSAETDGANAIAALADELTSLGMSEEQLNMILANIPADCAAYLLLTPGESAAPAEVTAAPAEDAATPDPDATVAPEADFIGDAAYISYAVTGVDTTAVLGALTFNTPDGTARLYAPDAFEITEAPATKEADGGIQLNYIAEAAFSAMPTAEPTEVPTEEPTEVPTEEPTEVPTEVPTEEPTEVPTEVPTEEPTEVPTEVPTEEPTEVPTEVPTEEPTEVPTEIPTEEPTEVPTEVPTEEPTEIPTEVPTDEPVTMVASKLNNVGLTLIITSEGGEGLMTADEAAQVLSAQGFNQNEIDAAFADAAMLTDAAAQPMYAIAQDDGTGVLTVEPAVLDALTAAGIDTSNMVAGEVQAMLIVTEAPTIIPTEKPTVAATEVITEKPTVAATEVITEKPTVAATEVITEKPTVAATEVITEKPTVAATEVITEKPTVAATEVITEKPTVAATEVITEKPTVAATEVITEKPTVAATEVVTEKPVITNPYIADGATFGVIGSTATIDAAADISGVRDYLIANGYTDEQTDDVSARMTADGVTAYVPFTLADDGTYIVDIETADALAAAGVDAAIIDNMVIAETQAQQAATEVPTEEPTAIPTEKPTEIPTEEPTEIPTEEPTEIPTEEPTEVPTEEPTEVPTEEPTAAPTEAPAGGMSTGGYVGIGAALVAAAAGLIIWSRKKKK